MSLWEETLLAIYNLVMYLKQFSFEKMVIV